MKIFEKNFDHLASREWIVTNGIGGFASSSICGANTRRYHGILIAALQPPTDRRVLVSKIEEKVITSTGAHAISTNQYPGTIHPHGYQFLEHFERMPLPTYHFQGNDFSMTKSIFMVDGSNTTVIEYTNTGDKSFNLELIPLYVARDYHHMFRNNGREHFSIQNSDHNKLKVLLPNAAPVIHVYFTKGTFEHHQDWYRDFEYAREQERGLDYHEDAVSQGEIRAALEANESMFVTFSLDEKFPEGSPAEWKAHELLRLTEIGESFQDTFLKDLAVSGDQFIVWRLSTRSTSVIAGYHWFTDWGRDTMIAMRGLIIAQGKKQSAESIFRTFLQSMDQGMIPNRFPDLGKSPEYNTIDASLWLFVTMYEYFEKFKDLRFIESVFDKLGEILSWHEKGTRYHIHVTPEGLLSGGEKNIQLTWMDAKVGDHVVTPRQGCAVEINALWYNALRIYCYFAEQLQRECSHYTYMAEKAKVAFRVYFENENGYLNDVVVPGQSADDAIRPNQVYALSLPFPLLENHAAKQVFSIVTAHLYTDYGLRSLSPQHPDFKGIYKGDQWERDHAYHQGTIWTYLWGEYMLAYLKMHNYSAAAKQYVISKSAVLRNHFYNEGGLHAISEIFDGENPSQGKGCIQQAWSIGMLMKVLLLCNDVNT